MGAIIGAIGGFIDCSSKTSSLAVQTSATNLNNSPTPPPSSTIRDQSTTDGSTSTFLFSLSVAGSHESRIIVDFDPFTRPITIHETGSQEIPISFQLAASSIAPVLTQSQLVATQVSGPAVKTTPTSGISSTSTSSIPVADNSTAHLPIIYQASTDGFILTSLFSAASVYTSPIFQTTPTSPDNGLGPISTTSSSALDSTVTQSTTGVVSTSSVQDTTTGGDGRGSSTTPVKGSTPGDGGAAPTSSGQESTTGDGGDGSTTPGAASSTQPPGIVIGSLTASTDSASNVVIGSQTLTPGSVVTISGQQVSIGPGGAIVINGASPTDSDSGAAPTSATGPAVVVVDGTSITANSASGFVIGSQTLFPGSAITTGGEVITLPLPSNTGSVAAAAITTPVFIIGSATFTENSQSDLVLGTQTLTPGGVLTVDGQTLSLSPTGNVVVVNGDQTNTLVAPAMTSAPVFVIGSATFTENAQSDLVFGSQTLTPGGRDDCRRTDCKLESHRQRSDRGWRNGEYSAHTSTHLRGRFLDIHRESAV